MKVSVIIPVYNRPREVAEAIRSVLGQTMSPLEVLVIDDGSTDGTATAVEAFGPPVRLLRQDHAGPAAARNRAAHEAAGDWISFLDSDDLWLPQKLSRQAAALEKSPAASILHTDGWAITGRDLPPWAAALVRWEAGPDGRPTSAVPELPPTHFSRFTPAQGPDALPVYLSNPMLTPSVIVRRDAFLRAGGFDTSFTINEDADLFVRLMAMGKEVIYVPEPLVIIRSLPDGVPRDWMLGLSEAIRVQQKALDAFPALRPVFREALARSHRTAAQCALVRSTTSRAARLWLRSFFYRRPTWRELAVAALLVFGGHPGRERVMRRWQDRLARYR